MPGDLSPADHARLRGSLRARVKGCTLCPLHQRCSSPVPWRGPILGGPSHPRLVVIGEAPGRQEDKAGKPFVGPSGDLVDTWLRTRVMDPFNRLAYEEVAFVNAVSCYPNRTPSASEIATCRATLHAQLGTIQPDMALVLGGVAVSSFWKNMRIGDIRGRWWGLPIVQDLNPSPMDVLKWIPAIATWHPAAVLRGNGAEDVHADLAQVRMALFKDAHGPYETPSCFMCGTEDMKEERWIACDLGNGTDVTNVERPGPPLSLCICKKHYGVRYGKIDQKAGTKKRRTKKEMEAASRVEMF